MGFFDKVAKTAIATAVTLGVVKVIGDIKEKREEEKRRKNTPCYFDGNITENAFINIAYSATRQIKKRNVNIEVCGPVVYGTVESQSGLSDWSFSIDFNDYGSITGTYWLHSNNQDSIIPQKIASIMSEEISKLN